MGAVVLSIVLASGLVSIANSPASSQSLIGDGLSAEKGPYSPHYRGGAYDRSGKGLAGHSGHRAHDWRVR